MATWQASVSILTWLRTSHLTPKQLGLWQPCALNLMAHAVEEGDTILVLIKTEELRQDLPGFL